MKRKITIGLVLLVLITVVLAISTSVSTSLPVLAVAPTHIPDENAIPGDAVSRSAGGLFKNAVGIEGSADEVQLVIVPYTNATASVMEIHNILGTPVWYIDTDGDVTAAGSYNPGTLSYTNTINVAVPTAVGTATPGIRIANLGVADSMAFVDGASVVGLIQDDGFINWEAGADFAIPTAQSTSVPGINISNSSVAASINVVNGESVFQEIDNTFQVISVPTAQATNVPGLTINNSSIARSVNVASGTSNFADIVTFAGVDMNGTMLDLDADNDTSITADSDDQIDIELEGADTIVMKAMAGADSATTTNNLEIAGTTAVDTTGTNTHNFLNIDIAVGNSSGGTNAINAVAIDNITGDAEVTETGIVVGTGFDIGADMQGTILDLDVDNDTSITASTDDQIDFEIGGADIFVFADAPDAGASGDLLDITDALAAMSSDNFKAIDVNLTNADNTGSSTLYGIALNLDAQDAETVESAIFIGGAWDHDMTMQNGEAINNDTDAYILFTDGTNTLASIQDTGTTSDLVSTGSLDVQGGVIVLQNDEVIDNSADATIAFTDGSNTLFSIVDAGTTGNATSTGTLTVDGASTLTGVVVASADVTIDDDLIIDPQAATIAVTADSTITALGTVTKLSAAASCGTATITAGTAGQVLILMGPAANTITITDTGTLKLSGNCALTANDTLTMISDGTNWNEVSCNDNG